MLLRCYAYVLAQVVGIQWNLRIETLQNKDTSTIRTGMQPRKIDYICVLSHDSMVS